MKCGYCGKPLRRNAKFCTHCGKSVTDFKESDQTPADSNNSGAGAVAALSVLIIVLLTCGTFMIMRGMGKFSPAVSPSDTSESFVVSSEEPFYSDPLLFGIWCCEDKSAAGYTDSDYGVETLINLTIGEDGSFKINYRLLDTGIIARRVKLGGSYSAKDGLLELTPDLSDYSGSYFSGDGSLVLRYSVEGDRLTITVTDGQKVIFKKSE